MKNGNRETSSDKNYRGIRIKKLLVRENLDSCIGDIYFQIANIVCSRHLTFDEKRRNEQQVCNFFNTKIFISKHEMYMKCKIK